jgi:hypothetical protein
MNDTWESFAGGGPINAGSGTMTLWDHKTGRLLNFNEPGNPEGLFGPSMAIVNENLIDNMRASRGGGSVTNVNLYGGLIEASRMPGVVGEINRTDESLRASRTYTN